MLVRPPHEESLSRSSQGRDRGDPGRLFFANFADDGEHSLAEANVYYTRLAEPIGKLWEAIIMISIIIIMIIMIIIIMIISIIIISSSSSNCCCYSVVIITTIMVITIIIGR